MSSSPTTSTTESTRSIATETVPENGTNTPRQSETKEPPNLNPLSNFLEIFFNTAFFLCLCPFRVKRSKSDEKSSTKPFIIVTWWPQRVICAILTLLSLFWFLREIRISVPNLKSPAGYVQLVLGLVTVFVELVVVANLWFNREAFLSIVNFVADHLTDYKWTRKFKLIIAPIFYTIMGLVMFLTIRGYDVNGGIIEDWSWNKWFHSLVYAGRYNFFVSEMPFPRLCNNTVRIVLDGEVRNYVKSVDTLLVVLTALGSFGRHMIGPFTDFLMLMTTLTLWTATKMFCHEVKNKSKKKESPKEVIPMQEVNKDNADKDPVEKKNSESDRDSDNDAVSINMSPSATDEPPEWKKIYEGYKYLKKLADLINKTLGLYVTASIVEDVLYYAVFFDLVFAEGDPNWGRILGLLFFFASTCTILILCADLSHRMSALKSWLSVEENRKSVPVDMVMLLINHVDSKQVAIKGSRIFPVTYQTLSAMVGVTGTYFILCVKDKTMAEQRLKC